MMLPMRVAKVNLAVDKTEMIKVILFFFKERVVRSQQWFSMGLKSSAIVSIRKKMKIKRVVALGKVEYNRKQHPKAIARTAS